MAVDVLVGLQWGDEGKGKVVDVLAPKYDIVARFQGGPNAGHTLEFDGIKHVLHQIPSGIFRKELVNVIGNGVVLDLVVLRREIAALEKLGVGVKSSLLISKKAALVLPTHKLLDRVNEESRGANKIGSTLKGIGPAYQDKIGRTGLRIGDILSADFKARYQEIVIRHQAVFDTYGVTMELAELEAEFFEAVELARGLTLIDSEYYLNDAIKAGKHILAEGAQGSMLDIDFGTYPFVTSSTTLVAGACTGLGVAPRHINKVYGIFKAYATRVGSGPFPTELENEVGERIRKSGNEFGSTTGRPRRCGWLDLPALKYSIMLNGVTELHMMKADVLDEFDEIAVCTHYKNTQTGQSDKFPFSLESEEVTPIYKTFAGWNQNLSSDLSGKLPTPFEAYIDYLEKELEVPIRIISVGPDRKHTIIRNLTAVTA